MRKNDLGQMMVFEAIIFAVFIIVAIFFVYQLSPRSSFSVSAPSAELATLADDVVRGVGSRDATVSGFDNFLEECIGLGDFDLLTGYINTSLPVGVYYNLYVSNGSGFVTLYSDEVFVGGRFGEVSRGHYLFYYGGSIVNSTCSTLYGPGVFDLVLEVWRI
ncbi:MAG: hypothetical protein DRN81_05410 [Thermoproteota archaeon]|nr:MAG: hypothetical protein DRN81_05410 [Candidatus Korarchaeota archaeon]